MSNIKKEPQIHKVSEHILSILNDTSFPPLVMLDGDWGEGKTYFTKHTLIPDLKKEKNKCVFFSLTGLSNINDFKDRLLSASYIKSEVSSDQGNSISSMLTPIISHFGGKNGDKIASILGGASGLIKEAMLSKLNDRIIIIDDLDRVTKKNLCNLIIGECLQLSDDSNLKFIFIVNDKKSLADKAFKEKVFSGVIKLNTSLDESIEVSFSNYSWFSTYRKYVTKAVQEKNIKNLRVLKRASKKIDEIFAVLKADTSLNLDSCMSSMVSVTILVMYYHYEQGFSESELWEKSKYKVSIPSSKNKKNESHELIHINPFLTKELINFYVGGSNWKVSRDDFGRLPKKDCPIDSFMFSGHLLDDDETFQHNVDILKKFVFDDFNVPFSKWFEASYFYNSLYEREFYPLGYPRLNDKFDELINTKTFDYIDLDGRNHRIRIDSEDNFIHKKYLEELNNYKVRMKKDNHNNILNRMVKSWEDVDLEVFQTHQLKPFFNQFSNKELTTCINGWSNSDLLLFSNFIYSRFESSSMKIRLSDELKIMEKLSKDIRTLYTNSPKGRRKGSFKALTSSLSFAVKSLTKNDGN